MTNYTEEFEQETLRKLPEKLLEDLRNGMSYREIDEEYGINRHTMRYRFDTIQDKVDGHTIEEGSTNTGSKEFYYKPPNEEQRIGREPNHVEEKRASTKTKQAVTREVSQYMEELEQEIKGYRKQVEPPKWDSPQTNREGNQDLIIHETDPHFGDVVKNQYGETIYNSEIAEQQTRHKFDEVHNILDSREEQGVEFDTAHLLLGGDLVTNEAIYDSQPHHIDEHIRDQLNRATAVYMDEVERLADRMEEVQIVAQSGNHGENRVKGSSKHNNADDFLYDRMEMLLEQSDYDNINFIRSDRTDSVTFNFRSHKGYLTHGQNRLQHIGTSSPQSDWLSIKDKYRFDLGFRGHYHEHKVEPVNDAKVIETPSRKPAGDFEDSLGVYGEPFDAVYGSSDEQALEWIEYINLPERKAE